MAAPMAGGVTPSTLLTLGVIPTPFALVRQWQRQRHLRGATVPLVADAHPTAATP